MDDIARIDGLTRTLCGNTCYILTITNNIEEYMGFSEE